MRTWLLSNLVKPCEGQRIVCMLVCVMVSDETMTLWKNISLCVICIRVNMVQIWKHKLNKRSNLLPAFCVHY